MASHNATITIDPDDAGGADSHTVELLGGDLVPVAIIVAVAVTYCVKYFFEVRDKSTNRVLYSRGFASIFGEWETTEEAKHAAQTSAINLSTGWEMRLIEAEAKLVSGDVAGAMTLVNGHRVALALAPWTAVDATEAWVALKRERGIEMWLESRRLGDFRRWAALSRPGVSDDMTGRNLCFATPLSEKQTNTNFVP